MNSVGDLSIQSLDQKNANNKNCGKKSSANQCFANESYSEIGWINPLHLRLHISYTRLCWLGNLVPIKCVVVTLSHANEMAIVDKGLHNGKAALLMEREPGTEDQDEFEFHFLWNN